MHKHLYTVAICGFAALAGLCLVVLPPAIGVIAALALAMDSIALQTARDLDAGEGR